MYTPSLNQTVHPPPGLLANTRDDAPSSVAQGDAKVPGFASLPAGGGATQ